MEDSEFVVVDEDSRATAALKNLNESMQAYGAARESLLKGVALLHDTLNLTMELALKNTPPDFDSNSDDLMEHILGSLNNSSEAVLRDHVKSLCSKLVAVKTEYEDLAKKFEELSLQKSAEPCSEILRLAGILAEIDACLPPPEDPAPGASNYEDGINLDALCDRAEAIRDRVKLALQQKTDSTRPEQRSLSVSVGESDYVNETSVASTSKAEQNMDISRMIREEVSSVFQAEMQNIMERQRELIRQALSPIAAQTQLPPPPSAPGARPDACPTEGPSGGTGDQDDIYMELTCNWNDATTVAEGMVEGLAPSPRQPHSPHPPLPSRQEDGRSQPMLLPLPHRFRMRERREHSPSRLVCPRLLPSTFMVITQSPPSPRSRRTGRSKPSYLPDDERPLCPKCQTWLPDRHALEVHLDSCLQ